MCPCRPGNNFWCHLATSSCSMNEPASSFIKFRVHGRETRIVAVAVLGLLSRSAALTHKMCCTGRISRPRKSWKSRKATSVPETEGNELFRYRENSSEREAEATPQTPPWNASTLNPPGFHCRHFLFFLGRNLPRDLLTFPTDLFYQNICSGPRRFEAFNATSVTSSPNWWNKLQQQDQVLWIS